MESQPSNGDPKLESRVNSYSKMWPRHVDLVTAKRHSPRCAELAATRRRRRIGPSGPLNWRAPRLHGPELHKDSIIYAKDSPRTVSTADFARNLAKAYFVLPFLPPQWPPRRHSLHAPVLYAHTGVTPPVNFPVRLQKTLRQIIAHLTNILASSLIYPPQIGAPQYCSENIWNTPLTSDP